jgi:hypothetical protein
MHSPIGIPGYGEDMPGYIDYSKSMSKRHDVISLIDGGTWTITITFPKGFLFTEHQAGENVQISMDSNYDDIMQDELNDVEMTCTVQ